MTRTKVTAPTAALERLAALHAPATLSALALEVLCFLLRSIGRESLQTWYGQRAIAARLRRSERSVRGALAQLELAGLIHRQKRNRATGRLTDLTTVPFALVLEQHWWAEVDARRAARRARLVVVRVPRSSTETTSTRPTSSSSSPPVAPPRLVPPPAPLEQPAASAAAPRPVVPRGPAEAANLAAILASIGESQPAAGAGKGTSGPPLPSKGREGDHRAPLELERPPPAQLVLPNHAALPLEQARVFRAALAAATGTPWRPVRETRDPEARRAAPLELVPPAAVGDRLERARAALTAMARARAAG